MNVLYVNAYDSRGGAARGAYRLHCGLRRLGVDCRMLVLEKLTADPTVVAVAEGRSLREAQLRGRLVRPLRWGVGGSASQVSFNLLPTATLRALSRLSPDVVHLHWIGDEMLAVHEIPKITAPVVWRLADEWVTLGAHHYLSDTMVRQGSEYVPLQETRLEAALRRRKERILSAVPVTWVTGSRWLAERARESPVTAGRPVHVIPNGLDLDVFRPRDRVSSRDALAIPRDGFLVMFGALGGTSDARKGASLLHDALWTLSNRAPERLVRTAVFGEESAADFSIPFPTHFLGHLADDRRLATAYSAADVLVVPSIREAFGQTASEAQACGTPVVAFDTTGVADIVVDRKTGYLAAPYVVEDLAGGISWVMQARSGELRAASRRRAVREYGIELQANRYRRLYSDVLGVAR